MFTNVHRLKKSISFLFASLVLFSACSTPSSPESDPQPPVTSITTSVADTGNIITTLNPPTEYPLAPDIPLSTAGPWFVFAGQDSLWAVNPDGSGLTHIADQVVQWDREWRSGISPSGGHLAYITGLSDMRGLALHLYSFDTGHSRLITSLVSADLEPVEGAFDRVEAIEAITYYDSLAWSPDGSRLAFVAAIDGPSSDLYLYSLNDQTITRLTDGDSQTHRLSWSPDGRYILHFGVHSFGTGAGYSMAGAWAAAADNSIVINLYEPNNGDEIIDGWWDDQTAIVHSWNPDCGHGNLRTLNILTGEQTPLWEDYLDQVVSDPISGTIVFTIPSRIADCNRVRMPGVFAISKGSGPVRLLGEEPYLVQWSPGVKLFFARTEFGGITISSNSEWIQLKTLTENLPVANPADKSLAWYGADGLWLSPLLVTLESPQPEKVFDGSATFASWDPGGANLFFIADDTLYLLQRSDQLIFQVGSAHSGWQGSWVLP